MWSFITICLALLQSSQKGFCGAATISRRGEDRVEFRGSLRQQALERQKPASRTFPINVRNYFRMISDAFSAIMITGEFVLPETIVGMIEASTIRNLPIPCTRSFGSTTAKMSFPILHVPTG